MMTFTEFSQKIKECKTEDDLRALEKDPELGLAAFSQDEMALLRAEWHRKAVLIHQGNPEGGTDGLA